MKRATETQFYRRVISADFLGFILISLLLNQACISEAVYTSDFNGKITIRGKTTMNNARVHFYSDQFCKSELRDSPVYASGKDFSFTTSTSYPMAIFAKDEDPNPKNTCTQISNTFYDLGLQSFQIRPNWAEKLAGSDATALDLKPLLQTKDSSTGQQIYSGGTYRSNLPGTRSRFASVNFKIYTSFDDFDHAGLFPAYKNSSPFERIGLAIYKNKICIEVVSSDGTMQFIPYGNSECFNLNTPISPNKFYQIRSKISETDANQLGVEVEVSGNGTFGAYNAVISKPQWYSSSSEALVGVMFRNQASPILFNGFRSQNY
jgi:hypothetical protein